MLLITLLRLCKCSLWFEDYKIVEGDSCAKINNSNTKVTFDDGNSICFINFYNYDKKELPKKSGIHCDYFTLELTENDNNYYYLLYSYNLDRYYYYYYCMKYGFTYPEITPKPTPITMQRCQKLDINILSFFLLSAFSK